MVVVKLCYRAAFRCQGLEDWSGLSARQRKTTHRAILEENLFQTSNRTTSKVTQMVYWFKTKKITVSSQDFGKLVFTHSNHPECCFA